MNSVRAVLVCAVGTCKVETIIAKYWRRQYEYVAPACIIGIYNSIGTLNSLLCKLAQIRLLRPPYTRAHACLVDAIIARICNRLASAISAEYFTATEFTFRVRMSKSSTVIHGAPWHTALQLAKRPCPPERAGSFFLPFCRARFLVRQLRVRATTTVFRGFRARFLSTTMYLRDRLDLRRRCCLSPDLSVNKSLAENHR